jgi:N-formylglutamate amidohydrolase
MQGDETVSTRDGPPPPFLLDGCQAAVSPLVFASPHSGRHYPEALLHASRLPLADLRRCEDPHVDALVAPAARATRAAFLRATHARAWLDVNRAPDELDPDMMAAPAPPIRPSRRVSQGLGVIPRDAGPAGRIYRRPLAPRDVQARLDQLHQPWHDALAAALGAAQAAHGFAVLVDWHSMPPATPPRPADLVVGDLYGRSAHPALVALLEEALHSAGFAVVRNDPYAGAWTLERHGAPAAGIHAIQIELARTTHLDAALLEPGPGFADVATRLAEASATLSAGLATLAPALRPPPARWAAE